MAVLVVVLASGIDCSRNYEATNLVDNQLREVLEAYIESDMKEWFQGMYDHNDKTLSYHFENEMWSVTMKKKVESCIEENITDEMTDLAKAWRKKSREQQSGHIKFFMEHVLIEWLDENYRDSTVEPLSTKCEENADDKFDYYNYYDRDYSDYAYPSDYSY